MIVSTFSKSIREPIGIFFESELNSVLGMIIVDI